MLVVGLMSGTSMDGITAALVDIRDLPEGKGKLKVNLVAYETIPFSSELRERLIALSTGGSVPELCVMNFYLGELFADAALRVIEKSGRQCHEVHLIGSHGQTVCHLPRGLDTAGEFSRPSTLQIGEIDVIAERTGITTVGDFRPRDMAAGGEGAPLIPYVDYILFEDFITYYDFNDKEYKIYQDTDLQWVLAQAEMLKKLKVKVLALSYADLGNEKQVKEFSKLVCKYADEYGFEVYMADITLQRIGFNPCGKMKSTISTQTVLNETKIGEENKNICGLGAILLLILLPRSLKELILR